MEVLKDAITAQYATCEKFRHRVLSTMWEIEEAKRWSLFLERTLTKLQEEHRMAEVELKTWVEGAERQIAKTSGASFNTVIAKSYKEKETLSLVETHFDALEGLAIAHGLTDEDLGMADDLGMTDDANHLVCDRD